MRYRKTIAVIALLVLAMTTLSAVAVAAPPETGNGLVPALTLAAPPETGNGLVPALTLAAPPETGNGQIYVVQADDWLGTLADKFYGTPLAYPVIIEATNARAGQDGKYISIDNPHKISVGQALFIPALDDVPQTLLAEAPLEKTVMPADVIVNHTAPTEEQRDLLATLAVVGQPPELFNEIWLNSEPLKLAELRGKVVIIEFWTFG